MNQILRKNKFLQQKMRNFFAIPNFNKSLLQQNPKKYNQNHLNIPKIHKKFTKNTLKLLLFCISQN